MKAFDKWWSTLEHDEYQFITDENDMKEAWKAALEWAQIHIDNKCCFVECFVNKAIKQELGE